MQIAYEVLRLLSDGKFHSGTTLALNLKVSRSSIWKGISYLRKLEVDIQAVSGRGYRWGNPSELLNKKEIIAALAPGAQSLFPRIDVLNVITSTNDYLIQRLPSLSSGTVCTTEAQTAGKGRMGRSWRSPFGTNIYLSVYWRFPCKLHELSGLSLVVGIAILESLKKMTPLPADLGIKWPNDIWYKGSKLCGILLESIGNTSALHQPFTEMVIGVGMNINMVKRDINNYQANADVTFRQEVRTGALTDLSQILGFTPSRNQIIGNMLNSLANAFERFQRRGFADFAQEWARYDLLTGKTVTLSSEHQAQVGVAQGVNERGELCVKIGPTLKAIRYGDISVRPEE
ncbi:MAG: biotin--[acetyl-CoA-carboxylase] ligase [Gammaproteobacteria bacterium]|nr:biotin--[acetyl-CoA-carboxylase] ligase [Gammaproteobacteria bacterium]